MAQFLTILSALLILAVFKPIVGASSKGFSERRDRAPYIEASEYGPQNLGVTNENRSRKGNAQLKEQSTSQTLNPNKMNNQETKDTFVDTNIRSVFSTNFGPGLHLFNNTAPFLNEPHFKSYKDQMIDDAPQPQPYPHPHPYPYPSPSFSSSSDNRDLFKVQRSPDGKLSLVYNETHGLKNEKDTKTNHVHDKRTRGSSKGNPNNRIHTHISNGLPLKKETSTSPALIGGKPEPHIAECLEEEEIKSNKTYCSHLRNYPKKDHLEELIEKKFSNLEAFFGEDLIVPETIDHRMGNDPNEEFFCRSRQVVIYPQSGQNEDYEWFYIVNSDKFKQGIRIEECLDPYTPCGGHVGLTLPSYYETSCEQHYIYRTLVAYDGDKDTLFKETFRLPACCKCILRNKLKFNIN